MNFIAAMLLIVFMMDEEEAFWMLVVIVEQLLPREYYTNTMLASQVDQKVFVALIEDKLPPIHRHMVQHKLSLPLISTQWFLCIFVNTLPSEVRCSAQSCAHFLYLYLFPPSSFTDHSSCLGRLLQRRQQDFVSRRPRSTQDSRGADSARH